MKRAVILDMDGTLVDTTSIIHHVARSHPDYTHKDLDAFHRGSVWCPPHPAMKMTAWDHHKAGDAVLIVTARGEEVRALTETWLVEADIPHEGVWMRAWGDRRRAPIVKAEILAKLRTEYDIVHAYDDDPSVIEMWALHGIPTTTIPGYIP